MRTNITINLATQDGLSKDHEQVKIECAMDYIKDKVTSDIFKKFGVMLKINLPSTRVQRKENKND